MRVYLCVNRGLGLRMLASFNKVSQTFPIAKVYTQKKEALKEYQRKGRETIKESIDKSIDHRHQIMIFLLDIPDKYLKYESGEMLDPYTTEYDSRINTIYSVPTKIINHSQILSVESVHFHIKETRLRYKRTLTVPKVDC